MTEKLIIWLVLGAGLLAAAGLIFHGIRQGGVEAERQAITQQNTEAGNASDDARSRFDGCPTGLYDFATGKCRRSATGGRY